MDPLRYRDGTTSVRLGRVLSHIEDARYRVEFHEGKSRREAELFLRDLRKFYFFDTAAAMQQQIQRQRYQVMG